MNPFVSLFHSIGQQTEQGRRVAFCVVVSTHGSSPQSAGAAMLVHEDMRTEGTLGGGCVEGNVRKEAFTLLGEGRSALLSFNLDRDDAWADGQICGGTMRIAVMPVLSPDEALPFLAAADSIERGQSACVPIKISHENRTEEDRLHEEYRLHIEAPAKLLIAGAGHVGAEVAKLAVGLDFETLVIDDRADFANRERLPHPIRPLVGDIEQTLREQPIDANTFVVIVTRGHKCDEKALGAVIESPARYIGMIGSRRKIKVVFDNLVAFGTSQERLSRVHSPIGLPIGGTTVPEIAISIVAELVQVRRKTETNTHVEGPITVRPDVSEPEERTP